jgi:hypothetical protein
MCILVMFYVFYVPVVCMKCSIIFFYDVRVIYMRCSHSIHVMFYSVFFMFTQYTCDVLIMFT